MMSDKVREVRAGLELSQAKLAEKLGVSAQSVYYWESGKRQPSKQELGKLSDLAGIKLEWWFSSEAEPAKVRPLPRPSLFEALEIVVEATRETDTLRGRVAELEAEVAHLRSQLPAAKPSSRAETLDEALARYGLRLADFQEHYQEKPGVIWTVIHAADRGEPNAADGLRTMAMPLQPMPGEVGEAARDGEL